MLKSRYGLLSVHLLFRRFHPQKCVWTTVELSDALHRLIENAEQVQHHCQYLKGVPPYRCRVLAPVKIRFYSMVKWRFWNDVEQGLNDEVQMAPR